ncbi:nucleotide exchange factor GrpE [bacterium CPR1]|nr:nucleotide exchange factor GrpE [bacterium CPR1]
MGGGVKPPSTAFLKPEKPASDDPLRAELARLTEGAEEEKPKIPPPPPARPEPVSKKTEESKAESPVVEETKKEVAPAGAQEPDLLGPACEPEEMKLEQGNDPRLAAELKELLDVVAGLESLSFLRPRVEKFTREGADLAALVSVYRLTSRTLKDELNEKNKMLEQFRKEFQKQRLALDEARKKELPPSRPLADPAENAKLQKEIKSLQDQVDASQEQRNRLLQDFQNMRNRVQVDTDLKVHREKENLIKKVLPVVDGFDRALETVRSATDTDEVVRGIEMLFRILMEALESEGLSPVITKDQMFDPRCHEAMGQVVTGDLAEDTIVDELNKGYYLGEKLLRPAMVRIAKAPEGGSIPSPPKPPPPEPPREESPGPTEGHLGEENVES